VTILDHFDPAAGTGEIKMTSSTPHADGKKTLVAYYSLSGNTARVARDVASCLGADIESIRDPGHGVGFFGYLKDSLDALRGVTAKISPLAKNPEDYALTIVGTPVWAGHITPALRSYLQQTKGSVGRLACFVTSGNTGVAKIVPSIELLAGANVVASAGFNAEELKDQAAYDQKLAGFLDEIGGRHVPLQRADVREATAGVG
jgi:flavodoxin